MTEKDGGESGGHLVLACVILDHVGNQSRVEFSSKEKLMVTFSRGKLQALANLLGTQHS